MSNISGGSGAESPSHKAQADENKWSTEATVTNMAGKKLVVAEVNSTDLGIALKRLVHEAGGPIEEHQKLFWQDKEILDDISFQELGFPANGKTLVSMVMDVANSFVWGPYGGQSHVTKDGLTFVKHLNPAQTVGVRAMMPLPRDACWKVSFSTVGTHVSVGVATIENPLKQDNYCFLYGDSKSTSWALCFGVAGEFSARHAHDKWPLEDVAPHTFESGTAFELKMRISEGRRLSVTLPFEQTERVLFHNLPEGNRLFAAASTVYGNSKVSIKHVP